MIEVGIGSYVGIETDSDLDSDLWWLMVEWVSFFEVGVYMLCLPWPVPLGGIMPETVPVGM